MSSHQPHHAGHRYCSEVALSAVNARRNGATLNAARMLMGVQQERVRQLEARRKRIERRELRNGVASAAREFDEPTAEYAYDVFSSMATAVVKEVRPFFKPGC